MPSVNHNVQVLYDSLVLLLAEVCTNCLAFISSNFLTGSTMRLLPCAWGTSLWSWFTCTTDTWWGTIIMLLHHNVMGYIMKLDFHEGLSAYLQDMPVADESAVEFSATQGESAIIQVLRVTMDVLDLSQDCLVIWDGVSTWGRSKNSSARCKCWLQRALQQQHLTEQAMFVQPCREERALRRYELHYDTAWVIIIQASYGGAQVVLVRQV